MSVYVISEVGASARKAGRNAGETVDRDAHLRLALRAHDISAYWVAERLVLLLELLHLPQAVVGVHARDLGRVDRGLLAGLLGHVRRAEARVEVGTEHRVLGVSIGHGSVQPTGMRGGRVAGPDGRAGDRASWMRACRGQESRRGGRRGRTVGDEEDGEEGTGRGRCERGQSVSQVSGSESGRCRATLGGWRPILRLAR